MGQNLYRVVVDAEDFTDDVNEDSVLGEFMIEADDFSITSSGHLLFEENGAKRFAVAADYWRLVEKAREDPADLQQGYRDMAIRRAEEGVMTPDEKTPTGS